MNVKKKAFVLLLALLFIVVAAVGGTLAYLQDVTGQVKNVFTTSDVDIELAETKGQTYQMIPGHTIEKDPKVTVKADSEKCYVFVKVEESETTYSVDSEDKKFDDYLKYEMADGWTQLPGENDQVISNVYYRVVEKNKETDQEFTVIKGNQVTVLESVTKAMMNAVTTDNAPTLTFTAYACQYMENNTSNFDSSEAWEKVKDMSE